MPPLCVLSHRRSGTHWVIDLLRANLRETSKDYVNLDLLLDEEAADRTAARLEAACSASSRTIVKSHLGPRLEQFAHADEAVQRLVERVLAAGDIVYVRRDGRDTLVSLYHYARRFRPELASTAFGDFIRQDNDFAHEPGVNRVRWWAHHTLGWARHAGVNVIQYEDLQRGSEPIVRDLAARLGLTCTASFDPVRIRPVTGLGSRIRASLDRSRTAVLPRAGRSGDWADHFAKADLDFYGEQVTAAEADLALR